MRFFLVDVKSITSLKSSKDFDKKEIDKLADSILECGGLLRPLVLEHTGVDSYVVINGDLEYYAAVKAREKDLRKGEMIDAYVILPKQEEAIQKQLEIKEPKQIIQKEPVEKQSKPQKTIVNEQLIREAKVEKLLNPENMKSFLKLHDLNADKIAAICGISKRTAQGYRSRQKASKRTARLLVEYVKQSKQENDKVNKRPFEITDTDIRCESCENIISIFHKIDWSEPEKLKRLCFFCGQL